jgi:NADH dehydrogenase
MGVSRVVIFGGTGFVGRHLTARLQSRGIQCRIPTRAPHRYRELNTGLGAELVSANLASREGRDELLRDCDAVINLVGILNEGRSSNCFKDIHMRFPYRLFEACQRTGIKRMLHMSALNASEEGPSRYLKSKGMAESRLLEQSGPVRVTAFRPSVIFGHDDSFFNRFAQLLQIPGPFPLACPEARFAPVYVEDVAEAFAVALDNPATWGRSYNLCGPRVFSLRELVQYTARAQGKSKWVVGLPDAASRMQARILQLLPGKPFSYDNYLSMQVDSVCGDDGLAALGIRATDVDAVVPFYLGERSERGRYMQLRRQA